MSANSSSASAEAVERELITHPVAGLGDTARTTWLGEVWSGLSATVGVNAFADNADGLVGQRMPTGDRSRRTTP